MPRKPELGNVQVYPKRPLTLPRRTRRVTYCNFIARSVVNGFVVAAVLVTAGRLAS